MKLFRLHLMQYTQAAKRVISAINQINTLFSVFLITTLFTFSTTSAQVVVSGAAVNGTYSTLSGVTGAFAAINGSVQTGNNIVITVNGAITETATATLNAGTWAQLRITPGTVTTITSTLAVPLLNLNGADNVMIDGRIGGTGTVKSLTFQNDNASGSVIQFTNDATSNTIRYCTLAGRATSTTGGVVLFTAGTAGGSGNDGNTLDHCDITKTSNGTPTNAVYSSGLSVAVDNSNNSITNCDIYDYFSITNNSNGIYIAANSSAWTLTGNKFFQSSSRTPTTSGNNTHRSINIITANGGGYTISSNIIGYQTTNGTGVTAYNSGSGMTNRFYGIEVTVATNPVSSIQGNSISAITLSTTTGNPASIFKGISVLAGSVNIGTSTGNLIGATSGTNSISLTTSGNNPLIEGISCTGTGIIIIQNNTIAGLYTGSANGIGHTFYGINASGSCAYSINNNTIGNSTANSISVGITTSTTNANTFYGISNSSAGTSSVSGNLIQNAIAYNTNAATKVIGINNTAGTSIDISSNTVHDLGIVNSSGAFVLTGMDISGTSTVKQNFIYKLTGATSTSTSATITGIRLTSGPSNCTNNIASISSGTAGASVVGINDVNGTNSIYHNSVSLSGSTTGATQDAALNSTNTGSINIRNNIFANTRTGSGAHRSINIGSPASLTLDFNDYIGIITGGGGGGANSSILPPNFINPAGIILTDYIPSNSSLKGTSVLLAVIPSDIDGTARCVPTMGAQENSSIPTTPGAISGNTAPCEGTSGLTYSISPVTYSTGYSWTVPSGWTITSGQGSTTIFVTSGNAGQNGQISVTASNFCGTSSASSLNVAVQASPSVTNAPSYSTCSAASPTINLTSSILLSTFTWTVGTITGGITGASAASGNTINQVLNNPSNSTPGSVQYIVTPTSPNSCAGTPYTITVSVDPSPAVNVVPNSTFCSGSVVPSINFTSSTGGGTFTWTSTTDVGFGTSGSGNIPSFTASNLNSNPITATVSVVAVHNGCSGNPRTFTLTIHPNSTPAIAADYCSYPGHIILTANPPGLTYQWYEAGILIPGATLQQLTVDHANQFSLSATNSYGCQATAVLTVANELVVDGSFTNFNAGSPAFVTGYLQHQTYYSGVGTSGLWPEGTYAVNTNAYSAFPSLPNGYHPNFHGRDHTNNSIGTRNFLMVNGSVDMSQTIWQQTVTIQPNTDYYFSAWGMNLNPGSPAQLRFEITTAQNGTEQVGTIADLNSAPKPTTEGMVALSNWIRFYSNPFWTSPAGATTATIRIINLNTVAGGNDFGLDDISFGTLSFTPTSTLLAANGGDPVCEGDTLRLTTTISGGSPPYAFSWSGPNGFTSHLQNPTIPNAALTNSGIYTDTISDGYGCAPQIRTISVSVVAKATEPVSVQVDRSNFCEDDNGTIILTATGGSGTYLRWYSGSCGGTLVGTGTPLVLASPSVSTTYYARWETVCSNSACKSISVNVLSIPIAPVSVTASSNPVCEGTSLTLTAVGGNGGTGSNPVLKWYSGSCGGVSIGTGTSITIAAPSSNTVYYSRWESGCGNSSCQSVSVIVNPLPVAPGSVSVDRNNFCADDDGNIILTANGGSGNTFNWYTSSCNGTPIATGTSVTIPSPAASTTYYGRWETPTCGNSPCESISVNVNTLPTAPSSITASANPICAGTGLTLTAAGGDGGSGSNPVIAWYSGVCGNSPVGSGNSINIVAPVATTTYYARWESGCGNSECASITVNIDPLPLIPSAWTAFTPKVCAPANGIVYTVNPVAGAVSYAWSYNSGNATINLPATTNSITMNFASILAFTTGTLSVSAVNACGAGPALSRAIQAFPAATVNAGSDQVICAGQSASLSGSMGGSATSISWTGGSGIFTPNPANLGAMYSPSASEIATGSVTLIINTNVPSGTCPAASDNMTIQILPRPVPVITGPASVCIGSTGNVYSTAPGKSSYSWVISSGGLVTSGGTATDNSVTVTWNTSGAKTVSVNYTDVNGCNATSPTIYSVTVNPLPNASISYPGTPYCASGTANVTRTGQAGGTYSSAPVGLSLNNTTGQINLSASTPGTYTVTYSFTNGTCSNSASATVVVASIPNLYNVTGGGNYCAGSPGVAVGSSGSQSGVNYQLQLNGVNTGSPIPGTGSVISFGNQTGAGTYTVVATDTASGCTRTMSGNTVITILPLPVTSWIYHL